MNKKKKNLILQYLLFYTAIIFLGIEYSKIRRKTKQPEPRKSTVRTLGVDWAAHGSLVWPYGLRMAAPLWGCGVVGCARPWEKAEG